MADDDSVDEPEAERPAETTGAVNVADPSSIRRVRRKKQSEEDQQAEFWKRVLADPVGRREVWSLLEQAGTFRDNFAHYNGWPNGRLMDFEAGKKHLGQRLYMTLLKLDRIGTNQMLDEHHPDFVVPKRKRD